MKTNAVLSIRPLGFQWETRDPFLFCVHHEDDYPSGNEHLGPVDSLEGRAIGQDFTLKDGWRMYHGNKVPGFPGHPHRGFETVTYVRKGLVDHSDSLGATGRFGNGDVQWMTAGKGVLHSEMFPLLKSEARNPFELFQIWLNLPKANKFVEPHYTMLWNEDIPIVTDKDKEGRTTEIALVAGSYKEIISPKSTPNSWAADSSNGVAIWTIKLAPNALWTLPKAQVGLNRSLYYYEGDVINVEGQPVAPNNAIDVQSDEDIVIQNGGKEGHILLLQGKPINEPVVQHGPFVMNTQAEIVKTMEDYQRTQFGGWPWPTYEHVHSRERGRFAHYADGTEEIKSR